MYVDFYPITGCMLGFEVVCKDDVDGYNHVVVDLVFLRTVIMWG